MPANRKILLISFLVFLYAWTMSSSLQVSHAIAGIPFFLQLLNLVVLARITAISPELTGRDWYRISQEGLLHIPAVYWLVGRLASPTAGDIPEELADPDYNFLVFAAGTSLIQQSLHPLRLIILFCYSITFCLLIGYSAENLILMLIQPILHLSFRSILPAQKLIVFYDGVCGVCNASVQFLLRHDRNRHLRYAALDGQTARQIGVYSIDPESIVVADENGRFFRKSDAILAIVSQLPGPWPMLTVFKLIPRRLRDGVYDLVARNRYRLMARINSCRLPDAETRLSLLD